MLVADVLFEFGAAPPVATFFVAGRAPGLEAFLRLARIEAVDDIPQSQDSARPEQVTRSCQGDGLPEVRQMVERVTGVDEVGGPTVALVAEEAGLYARAYLLAAGVTPPADDIDCCAAYIAALPVASPTRRS